MTKIIVLFFALTLTSCAFGTKTNYQGKSNFNVHPAYLQIKNILIAVHDMRPYVQNNDKPPAFTGIQKSLYGIPYNVTTQSGRPLADDYGLLIVNTMKDRNVSVEQREIPFSWSFEDVKEKIIVKEKGNIIYYIKMMEWKTEAHFRPAIHYDLKLVVYDDQAHELSNNQEKGFFYFDKNQPGKENLASATSDILEKLFAPRETTNHIKDSSDNIDGDSLFKSLPPEVKYTIRQKCEKDYQGDFAMQADCANKQATGWRQIN